MILVIDNYDSFTFNVVQAIKEASNQEIKVVRNDEYRVEELAAMNPKYLIVSPGPGNPSSAGVSKEAIKYFAGKIPVLGICLGHQAIAEAFGAKITGAKFIKHGIVEEIKLDGKGLFRSIGKSAKFTRYHSLVIDEKTLPSDFEVTARAADGDIMGIRHKTFALEGIQFHPESIASENCQKIIKSFLNYRREDFSVNEYLNQLISKKDLTEEQASNFMENVADGTMDERQMAAILIAMASKGPSTSEMVGCARALLKIKTEFHCQRKGLAEIVGTGGDEKGSFNISSMSALVAASCGQAVAKHGNRAVSSKSGAADFYENLGINIMASPEKTAKSVELTDFGFLMAPVYHSAMRYAAPVRKSLGVRTIMNILGPLLNPAGAEYEVLGVYSPELLEDYAHAAKALGAKRVMVICSRDGYDEIVWGAGALKHDGTLLHRTGLGHGDAMHLSDLDPDLPGLEVWDVHEEKSAKYTDEMHDQNGKIIWGDLQPDPGVDNGRGMAADIDSTSRGFEMWSGQSGGIRTCKGGKLNATTPSVNFRIYWDGDLQDELFDGTGSGKGGKIEKWNSSKKTIDRIFTPANVNNATVNNSTKSNPGLVADLFGDGKACIYIEKIINDYFKI